MDGIWLEDGTFQVARGQKGKFKGDGKGKGKSQESALKKAKLNEQEEEKDEDDFDFENDWKEKQVCLVNLKAAALNGVYGTVKEYLGTETILVDGKPKTVRRFMVTLEERGDKSIKLENLYKVMTGSLVKLRGLDTVELNDTIAECGRLDAATMRYDVGLSDGRRIKVRPTNVDFYARFATSISGVPDQVEKLRSANGLRDRLAVIEHYQYPAPQIVPATVLEEYAKKFPKSVVIGRSNAANPKGVQVISREIISSLRAPALSRLIFVSMPRDRCVAPPLSEMRHDELIRLGKMAAWAVKRYTQPVYFFIPGLAAKGPPAALAAATCAWPLYASLCTDMVVLESDRWHKSSWARLDALLAVWARKPLYVCPEKYAPPVELHDAGEKSAPIDTSNLPLSLREEEPLTISRPAEGLPSPPPFLVELAARAAEAEGSSSGVQRPTLAARRL